MKRIGILLITASALFLTGCGDDPPVVNKTAIEKSIHDIEAAEVKALAVKDAALFAASYTSDAILMSPSNPPMKGRDAIKTGMAAAVSDPNFKLEFSSDRIEISTAGDMAVSRGNYTLSATDPATKKAIHDKGSYVTVYRKQTDASWKAVLDINCSELAPTPPPAPKSAAKKPVARKSKRR
jgi:uncharacterized protein (TIGR02246 family)